MIALSLSKGGSWACRKVFTRFLTSISQILVIFEPDSNLDAKIRKFDFVPSYHRTKSKIEFAPKNTPYDLYILLYIL